MAFQPNQLTFQQGIDRINQALSVHGGAKKGIVTSRDSGIKSLVDALKVTNIPAGFHKWQLPVAFHGGPGTQFFISTGGPNIDVPAHSHDEGDGMRIILSGSIHYNGMELVPGDWMFIPKGTAYSIKTGMLGASLIYCYQCCCA